MRNFCVFCGLLLICLQLSAQHFDLGSWNVVNVKYQAGKKWSLWGEAQLRSLRFYQDFHYYEYKGALEYKALSNVKVTLGAGSYQTYKEGGSFVLPKNNDEFRLWSQLVLLQPIGKIQIEQRYRAEFRFTNGGYRNRFRYRVGASYAFGKDKKGFKPYLLSASNELFFTDKEPYFERNRILLALNYRLSEMMTMQFGYLHQFDYRINDETGRDFLQLGVFIALSDKHLSRSAMDTDIKDN